MFTFVNFFLQDPIIIHEITKPNQISTFWQLPQIMIITAGEIMFSITSLKFAFSQVTPKILLNNQLHCRDKIPPKFWGDSEMRNNITTLLQAPDSMKAVIMAISLMTNAIGNVITLLLTLAFEKIFDTDELVRNKI